MKGFKCLVACQPGPKHLDHILGLVRGLSDQPASHGVQSDDGSTEGVAVALLRPAVRRGSCQATWQTVRGPAEDELVPVVGLPEVPGRGLERDELKEI